MRIHNLVILEKCKEDGEWEFYIRVTDYEGITDKDERIKQKAVGIKMQNSAETERLFLSIVTTSDYEFIISLVNSKGWFQFIGERNVHSQAEAVAYW